MSGFAEMDFPFNQSMAFLVLPSILCFSFLGSLPKCSSNSDFPVLVCIVVLIVRNANCRLSVKFFPSSLFAFIYFFSVCIVLSTKPVAVCKFGNPSICLIPFFLQYSLKFSLVNAVPLSVLIFSGMPFIVV